MLKRLYVDNYRSFVGFECIFGPRQLIIGTNGSGKSSIFDVLTLMRDLCVYGDSLVSAANKAGAPEVWRVSGRTRTRWQEVAEQVFEIDVEGNGGCYNFKLCVDSWGSPSHPRIVSEELFFSGAPVFRFKEGLVHLFNDQCEEKVQYPFDWHRSAFSTVTERWDNTKLWWFKQWLDNLLFVSIDPRQMTGIAAQETKNPDQHLSNFADWYRHLRLTEDIQTFEQEMRDVFPGFKTLRLEEAGERRHELKARFSTPSSKPDYDEYLFSELSDGQRALIGLYAVLHFGVKAGRTVCFDEPNNFLSLREVLPWLSALIERTEEDSGNAQALIASHHPELLNRMAFKEGLILHRPEGRETRVRPFSDPLHTGLTAAELVARGWEGE